MSSSSPYALSSLPVSLSELRSKTRSMSKNTYTVLREFLIERLKEHPAIWDSKNEEHHKVNAAARSWDNVMKELAEEFGEEELEAKSMHNVKQLKSVWQNLCRTFRRLRASSIAKGGTAGSDAEGVIRWPFYNHMLSLKSGGGTERQKRRVDSRESSLPVPSPKRIKRKEVEQAKEQPNVDELFCSYIAEMLKKIPSSEKMALHKKISDLVTEAFANTIELEDYDDDYKDMMPSMD